MRPWTASPPASTRGRPTASMGPRPCGRGRKYVRAVRGQAERASMGPRPCGRGRKDGFPRFRVIVKLQWGHGLAVDGNRPHQTSTGPSCFNGATALRPWTVRPPAAPPRVSRPLQWGHGLAAVDGYCRLRHEPAPPRSFNGATALRPWTGRTGAWCTAHERPASMGPRPCGRGRQGRPRRGVGRPARASMGPRPCGRGRPRRAARGLRGPPASMGPRPCGRGRTMTKEMHRRARSFNGATALRPWTAVTVSTMWTGPGSFNGATALRPWTVKTWCNRTGGTFASMGPRPCGRGRTCAAAELFRFTELQWGHGLAAVDGHDSKDD